MSNYIKIRLVPITLSFQQVFILFFINYVLKIVVYYFSFATFFFFSLFDMKNFET